MKVSTSVLKYLSLVLIFLSQARLLIRNSTSAVDTQQVFRGTFDLLIDKNYSVGINIESYRFFQ